MSTPSHRPHRRWRRTTAAVALAAAAWVLALGVTVAVDDFPRGLLLLGCAALVAAGAWGGVLRRGWGRVAGVAVAAAALAAGTVVLADEGYRRSLLLLGLGALVWHATARLAFRPDVVLPAAARRQRPVLVTTPRSGDGRAARVGLAAAAGERGIEVLELHPGEDLETVVRDALARGADALAMAGGDGSQAVVAAVAAEHRLPYACIPAGTRNPFALDPGVDRDDVVGALDAFVDGGERLVDLAEVDGRVFVNNVSVGLYAEAGQHAHYRGAKLRTLLDTVPEILGPGAAERDVEWIGPDEVRHRVGVAVMVTNNRYRLRRGVGSGTQPRLEDGSLGVTVVGPLAGAATRPRLLW